MSQDTRAEQAFGDEAKKNVPPKPRRPWSALENIIALAEDDSIPAFKPDDTSNWYEKQREAWVRRVAKNRTIRPTTKIFASILSYYINRTRLDAFPGERELAEETGTSRNSVRKAICELKAMGYLKVGSMPIPNGNHQPGNCYTFFLPSVVSEGDHEKTTSKKSAVFSGHQHATAVVHVETAVVHVEHGSGTPGGAITSDLTTDLTSDITTDKTTLRVVSHEEDRDDVKPDRPEDERDEREVETQPDQPDDASASCASAPGSAQSFAGWDVRPADRPADRPVPPTTPDLSVIGGIANLKRWKPEAVVTESTLAS